MATELVLVRHATCARTHDVLLGRAIDAPLDEHGELQARALAERLSAADAALVECSPRRRTLQTAQAIAARMQRELRCAAALDEVDFGRWAGQPFAALERDRAWQRWNTRRASARTPGGEDMQSLRSRIAEHLRVLACAYPDATLVVVTHAEPIRALLLHALGRPMSDWHEVPVDPASISRVRMTGAGLEVDSVNELVLH